ncbi:hypothetical protein W97_07726 [Coniosporium apollinis CBS 100218]|uniref:Uncharacterized protein n=1 Tax=Coniosporium apollinis (strain CBS 100218) TaxID=1168221 RepID=R7Z2K8_CONA1|nr:uncharacterized protein W97_07726 [Coniosporium apollinis CBS 100218]EON68402.1 hypothetical protein W97_07726 [Coniosporium apollinis CBS 100218]
MSETLLPTLDAESWHWDSMDANQITFNRNGTGKASCHTEVHKYRINESLLTDDAFLPKAYTLSLEKGKFLTPLDAMRTEEIQYTPRFALRLVFDKSPYPPGHEWKELGGAPDAMKLWE